MINDLTLKTTIFNNPNPDCKKDCRFTECGPAMITAMYYAPVYDKHGNNLNPDGNTTTQDIKCGVCGKMSTSYTQYGQTQYKEI